MTPEFDRRCSLVLMSPLLALPEPDENGELDVDEYIKKSDQRRKFIDALKEAGTYEDLSEEDRKLFDEAEARNKVEDGRLWDDLEQYYSERSAV